MTTGYIVGVNSFKFMENLISVRENCYVKGTYYYKIFVNGQPLTLRSSSLLVSPALPDLASSLVMYFDDNTNVFTPLDATKPLVEDNFNRLP